MFRPKLSVTIAILSFSTIGAAPILAGICQAGPFAQETERTIRQQPPQERERLAQRGQNPNDELIPDCLRELTLTPQQEQKIKEIVLKANEEMSATWQQFSNSFLASVQTEALLSAAIEDHLSDEQRKQVRDLRRKSMQQHRVWFETSKNFQLKDTASNSTDGSRGNDENRGGDQPQSKQDLQPPKAQDVQEDLTVLGVALTDEQIAAADQMQERYMSNLRSQNRDIASLHLQLVCLEAAKLEEIETVLTPDQIRQLRENRKQAPNARRDRDRR